jgi:molybdopterin synthase catalytic subunit
MNLDYLINGAITIADMSSCLEQLSLQTGSGGHSLFLGQVRADMINGKRVKAIEYSAYEKMVSAEADKIKESVINTLDDVRSITILHSRGVVIAGEISLFVLVSAGHRKQAIEGCNLIVEMIKERLPVWKKEIFEDDSHTWK